MEITLSDFIPLLKQKFARWSNNPSEHVEQLEQAQLTTFEQFYAALRDKTLRDEVKYALLIAVIALSTEVDKRRVTSAVWQMYSTTDTPLIRESALRALGMVGVGRYAARILDIALNKNESRNVRLDALHALWSPHPDLIPLIREMIYDQTEDAEIRSTAIETSHYIGGDAFFEDYLQLLKDPSPDARLWAAYGLACIHRDISPALEALDHVAAFDHTLPLAWGWHVDREALMPLERIYLDMFDPGWEYSTPPVHIISPLPEYGEFSQKYRKWQEDWHYTVEATPTTTLVIDPAWLESRLRERWPDIEINIRQPRPKTYLLDWKLHLDGQLLIGGLHRDRYAIVVTAPPEQTRQFAHWIHEIIPHTLYLYAWADQAELIG